MSGKIDQPVETVGAEPEQTDTCKDRMSGNIDQPVETVGAELEQPETKKHYIGRTCKECGGDVRGHPGVRRIPQVVALFDSVFS